MLPEVKNTVLQDLNFPTPWQAVIYRNFNYVSTYKIAKVLGCDIDTVTAEAARLGLKEDFDPIWEKKGYQTIIRNNWYLLPYDQLLILLDISEKKLDYILKEEDFFSEKLGKFKPLCESVYYKPITDAQAKETAKIKKLTESLTYGKKHDRFNFFDGKARFITADNDISGDRIVHGFLTPCGDVFTENSSEYLPDSLLKAYKDNGVTGLWMHGVLSTLSPFPFLPSLCENYKERRKALNTLIQRCKNFGIKVYLYFNEPRCLPLDSFGKFPHLKGHINNGFASLCFEQQEVQNYLYEAVKDLLTECNGIGGIITITMSENQTHCMYRTKTNCPICSNLPVYRSPAAINNVFMRAIRDSGSSCELIANIWAWAKYMGWSNQDILNGITALDKDISVMCVSECELQLEKNGVRSTLIDYSISNPGPSEYAISALSHAKSLGHKTYAKIQVSNSWEMSAVPYLPVFDLVFKHLSNLSEIGIYDYMMSWTLGGYPSLTLELAAEFANKKQDFVIDDWYKKVFASSANRVHKAVEKFCEGFVEFPFTISCLYKSPKNLGSANLWSLKKEEKLSCMIGYTWDDYENWCSDYSYEKYIFQFTKLLSNWNQGIKILESIEPDEKISELLLFAKGAYNHFEYDLIHTKYAFCKRDLPKYKTQLLDLIPEARKNAYDLIDLIYSDGRIGFEASNHYYYTVNNIIEKLLNLDNIEDRLLRKEWS